jgi:hypothetical protein
VSGRRLHSLAGPNVAPRSLVMKNEIGPGAGDSEGSCWPATSLNEQAASLGSAACSVSEGQLRRVALRPGRQDDPLNEVGERFLSLSGLFRDRRASSSRPFGTCAVETTRTGGRSFGATEAARRWRASRSFFSRP